MSESNRTDFSIINEIVAGVTPEVGIYKKLPITAATDFSATPQTESSTEISSDRQKRDLPLVGLEAGGTIDVELAHGKFDNLIQGALYSNWVRQQLLDTVSKTNLHSIVTDEEQTEFGVGTLISVTNKIQTQLVKVTSNAAGSGDNSGKFVIGFAEDLHSDLITSEINLLSGLTFKKAGTLYQSADVTHDEENKVFTFSNLELQQVKAGDWIVIQPLGYFKTEAVSVSGNDITFNYSAKIDKVDGYSYMLDDVDSRLVLLPDCIINGVQKHTYSVLQRYLTTEGKNNLIYSGCSINYFNINLDTKAIISAAFEFVGLNSKYLSTPIPANRIAEADLGAVLNSSTNITSILLGGDEVEGPNFIQSGTIEINNNLRRQDALQSIGSVGIAAGGNVISGTLTTYFGSTSLVEQVLANTASSLTMLLNDNDKKNVIYDVPKVKFTGGSPTIEGEDTDVTVELGYRALADDKLNYQIKICSFLIV